jgi:hypothetical protein
MHIASLTAPARPGTVALPRWLLNPFVLLALAAVSVWLLDGFGIGPLNDGWVDLGLKIPHGHVLRQGVTSRILGSVPRALGTRLTDDSFVGWQCMLLLLSFLRAALFYDIVRRLLPAERLFALACGLLALFHPADNAWFWVDATGAHLGFVLALAACWSSLAYLQGGVRAWLFATVLFQFTACLTYTAYQPLMFAFPLGVWLLSWLQGQKPSWRRLIGVTALVFLSMAGQLLLLSHGVGRESRVADMHLHAVLSGYGAESKLFLLASAHAFSGFKPVYLLYAILPMLFAWLLTRERGASEPPPQEPKPLFHMLMLAGLVALAAASYFPYALSDVRFGNKRQLLASGIFLYAAIAYLLFVLLPPCLARWPRLRKGLPAAMLVLLTAATVVVGLEKRTVFVDMYRAEERLLAQVAAQVPNPKPGITFLVRVHKRTQVKQIPGFYNRPATLESALQVMYSDTSLHAAFMPASPARLRLAPDGLILKRRLEKEQRVRGDRSLHDVTVPYAELILVDYPPRKPAGILGREWLQAAAGKLDVSAYRPGEAFTRKPAPEAVMCTMLEKKFKPKYCDKK